MATGWSRADRDDLRANTGPALLVELVRLFGDGDKFTTDDVVRAARVDRAIDNAVRGIISRLRQEPGKRAMFGLRLSTAMKHIVGFGLLHDGRKLCGESATASGDKRSYFWITRAVPSAAPNGVQHAADAEEETDLDFALDRIDRAVDRLGTRLLDYFESVWGGKK